MLRVERILDEAVASVKNSDSYVPISVKYLNNDDKYSLGGIFHHGWLNHQTSFVDVKVSAMTNKITEVSIVLMNAVDAVETLEIERLDVPGRVGNLIIDMTAFEGEHVVRKNIDFCITLKDEKVYALQKTLEAHEKISMGNIDFILDAQSNIVGLIFSGFTEEEWRGISERATSTQA